MPACERLAHSSAILAAFGVFGIIGLASGAGLTRDADRRFRRHVHPRNNKRLTRVASAVSSVGAPHTRPALAIGMSVACHMLGGKRPGRVIVAAACATAVNKGTRLVLHQRRPPEAGVHHGLDVLAYPSGHCCAVAAVMTATIREISNGRRPRGYKALVAGAAALALATAWSRLYLDEHWLDDVIGGLSAGLGVGLLVTDA